MASVGCLSFLCLRSWSRMVWSARVVLEFGRKAYCVGEIVVFGQVFHELVVEECVD